MLQDNHEPTPVGVVLAGAGARGAYEAGALATLLPVLEARGRRPTIFVGTSAGAINAVLFASLAHLPAREAAEIALALWRGARRQDVIRSVIVSGAEALARYAAQLLGLPVDLACLLDPSPLNATLDRLVDWDQLHRNAANPDLLRGIAVTTTDSASGRTRVFVECASRLPLPPYDQSRAIDYVRTPLHCDHVMASAAIPVVFPPAYIADPPGCRGWYLDGGVRLNAPIKPAVMLGAERLVLLATNPLQQATPCARHSGPQPDIRAALADVLRSMLTDRMVEDIRRLGQTNELVAASQEARHRCYSRSGRRLQRIIPYVFAGPAHAGELTELALEVFNECYGGWRWLRQAPDFPVLHRLLGGSGKVNGELLSYFFFEHRFLEDAIALGQRDAQKLLDETQSRLLWETAMEPAEVVDHLAWQAAGMG